MSTESPAQPKLTGKQRAFADAYLGEHRFNATRAAAAAGYAAPAVEGSKNLRKPNIRAYITYHLQEQELSRDIVLALVQEDALRSDLDILTLARKAPSTPATAAAISAFLSARTTARTNLLKVHNILSDKVNVRHSGRVDHVHRAPALDGLSVETLEKLEAAALELIEQEHSS